MKDAQGMKMGGQIPPPSAPESAGSLRFAEIRAAMSRLLLAGLAVISVPMLLVSLLRIPNVGWLPVMGAHIGIVSLVLGTWLLRRRVPVTLQAVVVIGAMFLVALGGISNLGMGAPGREFLLLGPIFALMLIGLRTSLLLLAVEALLVLAIGFGRFVDQPPTEYAVDHLQGASSWVSLAVLLFLLGGLAMAVIWRLLEELRQRSDLIEREWATFNERLPAATFIADWSRVKTELDAVAPDGVADRGQLVRCDPDTMRALLQVAGYDYANPEMRNRFGVATAEQIAAAMLQHPPEEHELCHLARLHREGRCAFRGEHRDAGGRRCMVQWQVVIPGHDVGDWSHVNGIGIDVTDDVRRADSAQQLLNVLEEAVALLDTEDRFVTWNRAWARYNDKAGAALRIGGDYETFLRALLDAGDIPDAVDDPEGWLAARMERHRGSSSSVYTERRTGRILIRDEPLADGGRLVVFTDQSALQAAEAQVVQAAKLASLGEMAAGIAHEINQPLNVIRMAAGNIGRAIGAGRADGPYLEGKLVRIQQNIDRAAAIIDQLRRFGREADEAHEPFDPRDAVRGALGMLGESLRLSGVDLDVTFPEACRSVTGHPIQLEQVVLNLLSNARDAIAGANVAAGRIRVVLTDADGWVTIVVEDNGGGIPDEVMPKLFDPFFTTKEVGEGTGLGLSVSHGLIVNMGGTLSAANVDGGARFAVRLPVAAGG